MKKTIAIIVGLTCASVRASTETVNGITWTYKVSGGEASVGVGSSSSPAVSPSTSGSITIPSALGGYSVTSIGSCAFWDCKGLTSVTIPDGVNRIRSSAFHGCGGLTSVTIPDSVTSIESDAFYGCSAYLFDTTTIPGVKLVDGWAVGNTGSLSGSLDLTGIRGIGPSAFYGCSRLTSVTIPDSVTSIGSYAFSNCSASLFDTTTIPGVKLVDGWAVGNTGSLSGSLDLTGIRGIGSYTFDRCTNLTSVTISDSVTSIGDRAFFGCSGLTSVAIPDSVTSIGEWAFSNCTNLTNVTIPNGVTSIGYGTFQGCGGLRSITIPDSVTSIGEEPFYGCAKLMSFVVSGGNPKYKSVSGLLLSKNGDMLIQGINGDVAIPDGVTSIGSSAFYGCRGLTSVTMPDSMTSIGSFAFNGCTSLSKIVFKGNAPTMENSDAFSRVASGCVAYVHRSSTGWGVSIPGTWNGLRIEYLPEPEWTISADGTLTAVNLNGVTEVMIPDGVTSIGDRAFFGCSGLTSVTIPDGVTSIGTSAFYGCSGLTSVTIPDSVTSIGSAAFWDCSGLTSVTMPNSVTNFGSGVFGNCSKYEFKLCRMAWGGVQYALDSAPADRAIASVTVDGDCAIDDFVLQDGKVYDSVLYISNAVDRVVTLTLPVGYTYKTRRGARPLVIPESSQCILSITRLADRVFLVSREDLDTIE